MLWTMFAIWRSGFRSHAAEFRYTWKEKFSSIPKIAPFLAIVVGVMYVLYGGIATPSEAAGVGAAHVPDPGDPDLPAVEAANKSG